MRKGVEKTCSQPVVQIGKLLLLTTGDRMHFHFGSVEGCFETHTAKTKQVVVSYKWLLPWQVQVSCCNPPLETPNIETL